MWTRSRSWWNNPPILFLSTADGLVASSPEGTKNEKWNGRPRLACVSVRHHHHYRLSLNREGRWGTTDDFATSFFFLSIFPCSPLPSGACRTPGLSIPWCCLPTSSSVCLVFFPLLLCLARWFWPDLMSGKHDHTTAVCVSLRLSGDLRVVQLPAGSWHGLPRW